MAPRLKPAIRYDAPYLFLFVFVAGEDGVSLVQQIHPESLLMSSFSKILVATLLVGGLAVPAHANLTVDFDEGAPKDRFTFTNTSSCALKDTTVTLDLSGSKSGLIFDVTNAGAGVEVFQPLELVAGKKSLASIPKVKDGDNKITFSVASLAAGEKLAFTIDVDDTMGGREITVSGSEIQGAFASVSTAGKINKGTFGKNAKAVVNVDPC